MNKYLALCFALPAAGMLVAFGCNLIFPFGPNSVLSIDLYHMYATLIAHMHDIIYSGSGGAWSWNIGMGINYYTLFMTNVGSPLNAAIALFPKSMLPDLIGLGMVVKMGLSGLCAGWFLRAKWKRCDFWTVAFATMYALCGYAVNYYWNIMWMDVLFLLPLCMLGIEDLVERGRFLTYTLALFAAMICNYYIAALMCGFLVIYFIIAVFSRFSLRRQPLWIIKRGAQFALFSVIAAGLAAAVLLPVWYSLQSTSVVMDAFPAKWETYNSFIDVLKNHLPGAEANMRSGGLPHIYAGLLAIWLLPVYLLHKGIPLKERVMSLLALAFMIFCLNYNVPNFIWHGLHIPNDLPFRYSFCYSMLIVTMACPAARRLGRRSAVICGVWGALMLVFLYVTEFALKESINIGMLIATPVLIAAFAAIYMLRAKRRVTVKVAKIAVLAVVCVELTVFAALGVGSTGNMNRRAYIRPTVQYGEAAREVAARDDGFWRMDTVSYMTLNDPALYGFRGISHFSSMLAADLQDLLHKLGYHTFMNGNVRANRVAGLPNTAVADSMLGVKYRMALAGDEPRLESRADGVWRMDGGTENIAVQRNAYALPIAYMVSEDVLSSWNHTADNPFEVQTSLVQAATLKKYAPFKNIELGTMFGENMSLTRTAAGYRFSESNTDSPGKAIFTYTARADAPLYFYADGDQIVTIAIKSDTDGDDKINVSIDGRYPRIIALGTVREGETIEISLTLGRTREEGNFSAWLVALDLYEYDAAMADIAGGNMRDIEFGGNFVKGVVDVAPRQALFTSIPYDSGWKLYVDGRETALVTSGNGAFLAARLPEGQHEIELKWSLPGFDMGIKISLTAALVFVLAWVISRLEPAKSAPKRLPFRRRRALTVTEPEAAEEEILEELLGPGWSADGVEEAEPEAGGELESELEDENER